MDQSQAHSTPAAAGARAGDAPPERRAATASPSAGAAMAASEWFVGVDVGGTKVSIAALRGRELSEPVVVPTEQSSQERLIEQIATGVEAAIARADAGGKDMGSEPVRVAAVGVGIPSVIDFATGRARASVNVPLGEVPLRTVLAGRLGVPVYVDNDATCAAIAEAHDERGGPAVQSLVMLTVGTGVGGGIVIGGLPYRGATGAAGELGHTIIGLDLSTGAPAQPAHGHPHSSGGDRAPRHHGEFPREGSLEALAAGHALDALARECADRAPASALGRLKAGGQPVAGPELVRAVKDGDTEALRALSLLGERLGVGVANAINTFDPDVVAIGGGVSAAGDLLLGPTVESARRFVLPGVGTRTDVRIARSGPVAGVRGAALLAAIEHARSARTSAESPPGPWREHAWR